MSGQSVIAQLRALKVTTDQVRATPCVACGHPYYDHSPVNNTCYWPRVWHNGEHPCRCKAFRDPADTLENTT